MKRCILLILFLYYNNNIAQTSSGSVKYSMVLGFDEGFSKDKNLKTIYNKAVEGAKRFSLTLLFNENESLFQLDKIIEGQSSEITFAKSFTSSDDIIYTAKNRNEIITEMDTPFGQFLVTSDKVTNWTLLNESKVIDGYLCFKATAILTVVNSVKTFQFPIIAWYCPKISVGFGPKGYKGLPGLILELQERNITYGLNSITFDKNPRKIQKPSRGKKVTEQELDTILSEGLKD